MKKTTGLFLIACVVLVLGALPAAAQTGVNAKISGLSNGQAVSGNLTITGSASASTGVDEIVISINNNVVKKQTYGGIQQNASTPYGWNTNNYPNGEYTVKVAAKSKSGAGDSATARALVDNAPATVTGLSASHSKGKVTLTWNPNPEPDLIGYRVTRDGTSLGQTSATSLTDQPGSGDHSYSVAAVRYSPTQSDGKSGGTAGTSVSVPAAASGGGSSSGAGSGSGGRGGGSVPGYAGGGGKKASKGSGPSYGAPGYGGGWLAGGRSLAGLSLPGNLTLPGSDLPPGPGRAPADETFEEELPYDLGGPNGLFQTEQTAGDNVAALSPWRVIPPDGLRWVAAGLWLLVTAALLKFLERIVAEREKAEPATARPDLHTVKDEAA